MTMEITINQQALKLAENASLSDALAAFGAQPPFAAAVNGDFVPKAQYGARQLRAGDRVDVVQPVAGG